MHVVRALPAEGINFLKAFFVVDGLYLINSLALALNYITILQSFPFYDACFNYHDANASLALIEARECQ